MVGSRPNPIRGRVRSVSAKSSFTIPVGTAPGHRDRVSSVWAPRMAHRASSGCYFTRSVLELRHGAGIRRPVWIQPEGIGRPHCRNRRCRDLADRAAGLSLVFSDQRPDRTAYRGRARTLAQVASDQGAGCRPSQTSPRSLACKGNPGLPPDKPGPALTRLGPSIRAMRLNVLCDFIFLPRLP
jgi:hypothetical protein